MIVRQSQRSEVGSTVRYGIEPNERKPDFSLPFGKYWSKLQTVSEQKLCFGLKKIVRVIIFC